MELKWLLDFVSLADSGSFSAAARQRNITQSAFSRRIQALENWSGTELIDRSSHPVSLTNSGCRLLNTAQQIIRLSFDMKEDLTRAGDASPTFRFCVPPEMPSDFLPTCCSIAPTPTINN